MSPYHYGKTLYNSSKGLINLNWLASTKLEKFRDDNLAFAQLSLHPKSDIVYDTLTCPLSNRMIGQTPSAQLGCIQSDTRTGSGTG